ncbi:hypothetical protein BSG1_02600 [Bacillus sp. SG-1]|nr:hypothetical protein BSG1_02600 [Bacillus sp. SG-1]
MRDRHGQRGRKTRWNLVLEGSAWSKRQKDEVEFSFGEISMVQAGERQGGF